MRDEETHCGRGGRSAPLLRGQRLTVACAPAESSDAEPQGDTIRGRFVHAASALLRADVRRSGPRRVGELECTGPCWG